VDVFERESGMFSAELRRLLAEATPGRWYHLIDDYGVEGLQGTMFLTHEVNDSQDALAGGLSWPNAALIVAAVNALPALLDELDAAEARESRLRDAIRYGDDAARMAALRDDPA
jgi:hypothetical protein